MIDNIQELRNKHLESLKVLDKVESIQNRDHNARMWLKHHGDRFWQLKPRKWKQLQAYKKYMERVKQEYIEIQTNKQN